LDLIGVAVQLGGSGRRAAQCAAWFDVYTAWVANQHPLADELHAAFVMM
jgi:hypothetical protein